MVSCDPCFLKCFLRAISINPVALTLLIYCSAHCCWQLGFLTGEYYPCDRKVKLNCLETLEWFDFSRTEGNITKVEPRMAKVFICYNIRVFKIYLTFIYHITSGLDVNLQISELETEPEWTARTGKGY